MSLEIRKSNFLFIESNFSDIISEVRDGANGIRSDSRSIRKTIVFHDFSKLICIEELDKGRNFIELYWYDWYETNQQLIMKFHAHYHPDGTPASIIQFDPFHIHSNDDKRHHNESFRELNDILEFIRLRQLSLKR
ncbi:DUF6516 family protein [Paenibacillus sp. OK003]|uniref:toxin-antitoxin system TumE family protein n=1 Tax=Paenibacillus sp. OK003 TaxID=1884380 RepID=UPI0008C0FC62|nr:DUF6516 family protein [Paenibacillus sp. OK003]SEK40754.1 hypothetical protein SAMN05518856_10248 [Paenibacillus sp. OK003]